MGHQTIIQDSDNLIPLAQVNELSPGTLIGVNVAGVDLVLINVEGQLQAYNGRCPHMGTLLSEGELEPDEQGNLRLVCRAHNWRFDCSSGEKVDDPSVCLAPVALHIRDGQVLADVKDLPDLHIESTEGRDMQALPGPRGWPLIGSLLSVNRRAFHHTLEEWAETYGPLYRCVLGRRPIIVVSDEALANKLLKARPDQFRRTSQLEVVSIRGMNTQGVFMAEGQRWRKQRPVIMQSLDTRHLKQFFPLLIKVTERLRRRWSTVMNEPVDVQSDLMRFTVDVTTSLAFGQDMNTLETEGEVIQQHLDKIFPLIQQRLLMPIPYWNYIRLPKDRAAENSVKIIFKEIEGFIALAEQELLARPELRDKPENLLQSLLVAAEDNASEPGSDSEDTRFTRKEVTDNVMTMLLAGEDTTANSLAWVIYFLAKYPDVQDKLRAEIEAVLGGEPISAFEQVRAIPYLDAVIHESMRLKPVAPLNALEANEDFSTGDFSVKKGDFIAILTRAMAMAEHDFEDAQSFDPERWLGNSDERRVNQRAFIPFGSGPRLCPGRSLALLEMKLVLVMMMQNFVITAAVDLDDVEEELSFTMSPRGLLVAFQALK